VLKTFSQSFQQPGLFACGRVVHSVLYDIIYTFCCTKQKKSCFAPRGADNVEAIARLCKEFELPHIVNNAYGIQVSE
jgi:hypothetical protein